MQQIGYRQFSTAYSGPVIRPRRSILPRGFWILPASITGASMWAGIFALIF